MLIMVGKRLMFAIPSLIGVVVVTFLLTRALPGDPAAYFAGPAATKEAVEQIRKKLGFDKPLIEQFFRYTGDLAHGDVGLVQEPAHREEAVKLTGKVPIGHGNARFLQPLGKFVAFVTQGIAANRKHIGRRQAGERPGTRRRSTPVVDVGIAEIIVHEPGDDRMRQQDRGFGLAVRRMLSGKIGCGVNQELAREPRPVFARVQRDYGREIAAGAVAADEQPARVAAQSSVSATPGDLNKSSRRSAWTKWTISSDKRFAIPGTLARTMASSRSAVG